VSQNQFIFGTVHAVRFVCEESTGCGLACAAVFGTRKNPRQDGVSELTRIRSNLIVIPKKFRAKRFECLFRMFVRLLSEGTGTKFFEVFFIGPKNLRMLLCYLLKSFQLQRIFTRVSSHSR
jgi:hypothetical protein